MILFLSVLNRHACAWQMWDRVNGHSTTTRPVFPTFHRPTDRNPGTSRNAGVFGGPDYPLPSLRTLLEGSGAPIDDGHGTYECRRHRCRPAMPSGPMESGRGTLRIERTAALG